MVYDAEKITILIILMDVLYILNASVGICSLASIIIPTEKKVKFSVYMCMQQRLFLYFVHCIRIVINGVR